MMLQARPDQALSLRRRDAAAQDGEMEAPKKRRVREQPACYPRTFSQPCRIGLRVALQHPVSFQGWLETITPARRWVEAARCLSWTQRGRIGRLPRVDTSTPARRWGAGGPR